MAGVSITPSRLDDEITDLLAAPAEIAIPPSEPDSGAHAREPAACAPAQRHCRNSLVSR